VVAHATSPVLSAIWDELLPQLSSPTSLPNQLQNRQQAGHQAVILTQTLPGNLARLVTPIVVGGVARGYLSLVGFPNDFDPLDQVIAEQGATVCAVEMSRAKAVREAEKRLKGDLLTALIHENLSPRDARLWAQSMSIDLDAPHAALRFSWDSPEPPSRRRLETLVNGEIAAQDLKGSLSLMGNEIVCFSQEAAQVERPLAALSLARSVIKQGAQEYPDIPIRCGVGSPAVDLRAWRDSFREAGQALVMANRFREDKPLYFPDISVYRLLMQIEHNPELQKFEQEILSPLLAAENASELLHTLDIYFEHNGNLSQTADALFVHRNTLLYRMNRIATIAGLDLEDSDTRLALQLALICHRMLDSKSN
jgi:purine catabolism regulator